MFHECVLSTISSRFTVALVIQHIFACTKILREFSTTMTGFASFLVEQRRDVLIQVDITLGVEVIVSDIFLYILMMTILVIVVTSSV